MSIGVWFALVAAVTVGVLLADILAKALSL